jgi:hypothetical protein
MVIVAMISSSRLLGAQALLDLAPHGGLVGRAGGDVRRHRKLHPQGDRQLLVAAEREHRPSHGLGGPRPRVERCHAPQLGDEAGFAPWRRSLGAGQEQRGGGAGYASAAGLAIAFSRVMDGSLC